MNPGDMRKCQSCRRAYPRESMFIFTAPGRSMRVCRECYLKLTEQYLSYAQAEFEFMKQMPSREEDLPF